MSIGPRKLLAGLLALIVVAVVWLAPTWIDVEIVVAAVAAIATLALLAAMFVFQSGRRKNAKTHQRHHHTELRVKKLETERDQLRRDVQHAREAASQAQARTQQMTARITQLENSSSTIAGHGRHISEMGRRLDKLDNAVPELRDHQRDQFTELAALVRRVGRSSGQIDDVRAAAMAELAELRQRLQAATDANGEPGEPATGARAVDASSPGDSAPGASAPSASAPGDAGAGTEVSATSAGASPAVSAQAAMDAVDRGRAQQLTDSGLLDPQWYRREAGLDERTDPAVHYLGVGYAQGLAPAPWIDTADLGKRLLTDREPVGVFLEREAAGKLPQVPELIVPLHADDAAADLELRWRYLLTGGYHRAHTFSLVRVIGNDLPPRHKPGQALQNLKFVLENEPELPGAKRHWLLNRITDPDIEAALVACLDEHGASYTRIPFGWDAYRAIGWRYQDFPKRGFVYGPPNRNRTERGQTWILDHVYHDKNRYVMHNNGARNLALAHARSQARWALPFDGNGFMPLAAWTQLTEAIAARPHLPYVLVPMARVSENADVLADDFVPDAVEEPQVVFRSDAREQFDPNRRYGRRPKVDLLQRLGVPGPWDRWMVDRWESAPVRSSEAGQYHSAGYVVRLSSGQPALEANSGERGWQRTSAIQRRLDDLDIEAAYPHFSWDTTLVLDEAALAPPNPDASSDRPTTPPLVAGTAAAALERAVADISARPPQGAPEPAVLAPDLLALTAMKLRSGSAPGVSEALDERFTLIADTIDGVLPGRLVPDTVEEAELVDQSQLPTLPAGWAAALLEVGRVCFDELDGPARGRLRRVATNAARSSGLLGPHKIQYFGDGPQTVWQLLDEVSAHAYSGMLGHALATARKADELRGMRAATVQSEAGLLHTGTAVGGSVSGAVSPGVAIEDDPAVALEAAGWVLLDQAIMRCGRSDEDPGWRWSSGGDADSAVDDDVFGATYRAIHGDDCAGIVMALHAAASGSVRA